MASPDLRVSNSQVILFPKLRRGQAPKITGDGEGGEVASIPAFKYECYIETICHI